MKKTKIFKNKTNKDSKPYLGVILIILLIVTLLFLAIGKPNNDKNIVSAAIEPREEKSPSDYSDLTYETSEEALSEANNQLSNMIHGNIHIIDGEDEDFLARLFLDYSMGEIIYWELGDPETEVYLEAYTGEILYYDHAGWTDGTLSQSQIESQAELIAVQFEELPLDKEEPEIEHCEPLEAVIVDSESNESTTETYDTWYVEYYRSKDNIISEDYISVILNPNGDLHVYYKQWNMDLDELSTTYTVTQTEAENTALTAAEENIEVHDSYKKIVRPNYAWTNEDGYLFGLDPLCVWEVWVEDEEEHLRIYHIDGTENTIVGGDFTYNYYSS